MPALCLCHHASFRSLVQPLLAGKLFFVFFNITNIFYIVHSLHVEFVFCVVALVNFFLAVP